jgi:hypothetical protein
MIASVWLRRHQLLRAMRTEPVGFIRINFVLLFLVICYTYILRLFAFAGSAPRSALQSTAYVAFLFFLLSGAVYLVVAWLYTYALRSDLILPMPHARIVYGRNLLLITAAGFGVAAVVSVFAIRDVFLVWIAFAFVALWYQRTYKPRPVAQDRALMLDEPR